MGTPYRRRRPPERAGPAAAILPVQPTAAPNLLLAAMAVSLAAAGHGPPPVYPTEGLGVVALSLAAFVVYCGLTAIVWAALVHLLRRFG